jgi:phosphoglycolate phosphatase-like HAD superfamily hydrolase
MKLVLFDLDGTLVSAGGAGRNALNKAVKKLFKADKVCSKFCIQGSTDKENFKNAVTYATNKQPTQKQIDSVVKEYLKILPSEVKKSVKAKRYKKIKGIDRFLKTLSNTKDVMIGLGTGNLKEGAYLKLGPSKLEKYFSFGGFGCDDFNRTKVLKCGVKRAEKLVKTKFKPSQVYIIGDTHKDVIAAKQADYHCAIVRDGFGDMDKIQAEAPEFITKDFSDLDLWLIWLGLKKDPKGVTRQFYMFPDTPIEHAQHAMTGADTICPTKMQTLRNIKHSSKKFKNSK